MLRRLVVLPAAAGLLALSVSGASAAAGTSWTVLPVPDVSGVAPTLLSVSCVTASDCVAVGEIPPTGIGTNLMPVVASWNGSAWTDMLAAVPARTAGGQLDAVSCATADYCMAVGYGISTDNGTRTLTELWNGSTWTVKSVPASPLRGLQSVSCSTTSFCAAVGRDHSGKENLSLIDQWNGSAWTQVANPPGTPSFIGGLSCPTTAGCYVVDGDGVDFWDGGTGWTTEPLAVPPGSTAWGAESISCTAAEACTVVGQNETTAGPVAEAWNGTAWTIQPTRVPARTEESNLASVSCVSAASCTAVGTKIPANKEVTDLFGERWNGSGDWGAANIPEPGPYGGQFFGVSCTSTVNCMAVGEYDSASGQSGLADALAPTS